MSKRNGRQKGPQRHAQGQHGEKTHRAFLDALQSGGRDERESLGGSAIEGHHRLVEERGQNDPAERASELNRRDRHDVE